MGQTLLLQGIAWSFIGEKYATLEKFEEQLNEEGVQISDHALILDAEIKIICEYVDEDDDDHKIEFNLKAENGSSFNGIELLFKIHNEVVEELDDNDYHFFEGLNLIENDDIKTFDLLLGS
jgi:hypothetical protein